MNQLTKDQAVLQDVAMRCASLIVELATVRADLNEARRETAASNGEVPEVVETADLT